jgi:hypothetical protein
MVPAVTVAVTSSGVGSTLPAPIGWPVGIAVTHTSCPSAGGVVPR